METQADVPQFKLAKIGGKHGRKKGALPFWMGGGGLRGLVVWRSRPGRRQRGGLGGEDDRGSRHRHDGRGRLQRGQGPGFAGAGRAGCQKNFSAQSRWTLRSWRPKRKRPKVASGKHGFGKP